AAAALARERTELAQVVAQRSGGLGFSRGAAHCLATPRVESTQRRSGDPRSLRQTARPLRRDRSEEGRYHHRTRRRAPRENARTTPLRHAPPLLARRRCPPDDPPRRRVAR